MVDLFEGDRRIRSERHGSRHEAVRAALAIEREYQRRRRRSGSRTAQG
jgi:hypothetical protein